MIKSIVKINNCPSFVSFIPSEDLPEFSKYNIIYGWNGAGKTSFSRILRSFELGENYYSKPDRISEFEFVMSNGTSINNNNLDGFKRIRVFNKDFIDDNVFCFGGPKAIYFLGKESKEDKNKIDRIENELINILRPKFDSLKSDLEKAEKDKNRLLQNKARDIKNALTTSRKDSYRTYDRTSLERSISSIDNENSKFEKYKILKQNLTRLNRSIQETSKKIIQNLSIPNLDLREIENQIQIVLEKTVTSQVINKLQTDQELNKWVEQGLQIHKKKSFEKCAFCGQIIPIDRLNDLEQHFNNEYKQMLEFIGELRIKCGSKKVFLEFPESSLFYDEFTDEYLKEKKKAEEIISSYNKTIDKLIFFLDKKEKNLFIKSSINQTMEIDLDSFQNINIIIQNHNKKTNDFDNQIEKLKNRLEMHYIAEFFTEYNKINSRITSLLKEHNDYKLKIQNNEIILHTLKKKLVSHHISAKQINEDLQIFLGRNDIQLNASDDKEGYVITRNGDIAKDLSEGEKTALAIVYFIAKIKESSFNLENSVVVIDDPVSSLDSNSLFQAFSFIKEAIKEAGQIFILTHHFDYFRQIKNWFSHYKPKERAYFMIICHGETGHRNSSLEKIDHLLIDYESEYHFLFSVLYKIAIEKNQNLESIYPVPNIARKFLESFLAFRVPLGSKVSNIYERLQKIDDFDEKKKERIRRFTETHSHPRYEYGVQDFDMSILNETQDILNDLMELVKKEDKKHYDFLIESVTGKKPLS